MEVVRSSDASEFLELALPLLERDEARNQLALGIAGTIVEQPGAYEEASFWVAVEEGAPLAAALRTPPYNVVLADRPSHRAFAALLDAVAGDDLELPGVVGNVPHVETAARVLAEATGRIAERVLSQGVYALRQVRDVRRASGAPRPADGSDRELLRRWLTDFATEALPDPSRELERIERYIDLRIGSESGGFWFWEDAGVPVSLSGFGGRTPSGIRIGPVYTPPEHRRRGYATTLVADQSLWLLRRGHRACFLFTDLENPTSNRIYEDIGYERVGDSAEYRFRER